MHYVRTPAVVVALALLLIAVMHVSAVAPGNLAFQRTWDRTDQPVAAGSVARTWIWGPEASTTVLQEDYANSPGGKRQVQYYDKSRMEINNPNGDPNSPFYVTNGLLVVELMTGRLQLGDDQFQQYAPAQVNVAGDPDDPLTYADLAPMRAAAALPAGSTITQRIDGNGMVSNDPTLAVHAVTAAFRLTVPGIDHQVASPFWTFLNSSGPVQINGQTVNERLFDPWFYATGFPITEAYWANVKVGGTPRLVLVQCFERRCLTYTPGNPAGFLVEAGNVGQHYHTWRYEQVPGVATPTATTAYEPATMYTYRTSWGHRYDPATKMLAPGSLATSTNGDIYVLDYAASRVQKYDNNGVYGTSWGSAGAGNGEFNVPLGIAVDSDGNVYVADTFNHRIQQFDSAGNYKRQWPVVDPISATALEPHSIVIGRNNLVYVGGYNENVSVIQIYDSVGSFLTQFGSRGAGPGQFDVPAGLAFDSSNQLYVLVQGVNVGNNRVEMFSSTGDFLIQWGSTGEGENQFAIPLSISVDSHSVLYIADGANERVTMHTPIGEYLGEFNLPGDSTIPLAVADDGYNNLYVVETNQGVLKFDLVRAYQYKWNDNLRGSFAGPVGIVYANDGTVLITDQDTNRVVRFATDGEFLEEWGKAGTGTGEFDEPIGIAVNSKGEIYVVDTNNARVQKFNDEGAYLSQWGSSGTGNGQFKIPVSIAVDAHDNVYVTDYELARIQKFTAEGSYLGQWGTFGSSNGQFDNPEGIAVHANIVYIADSDNNRVQAFDLDGSYLFQWGTAGAADAQFNEPTSISVDEHGYVFVVDEQNHRIQKFTSTGTHVATFGGKGSGDGQFDYPYGITVDPDEVVYVTDYENARVQVWDPER